MKFERLIGFIGFIGFGAALFAAQGWLRSESLERPVEKVVLERSTPKSIQPKNHKFQAFKERPRRKPRKLTRVIASQIESAPQIKNETQIKSEPKNTPGIRDSFEPVPDKEITELDQRLRPEFSFPEYHSWLWAGIGANYQFYEQSVESFGVAEFQNIAAPTTSFRAGFKASLIGADFSYTQSPGEISSSDTATLPSGSYVWESLTADLLIKPEAEALGFRLGIQHHSLPFLIQNKFSSEVELVSTTISMLSLGVDQSIAVANKVRFEWLLRYHYPLLANAQGAESFSITPKLNIDGALGGVVALSENIRAGVYWYSQFQKFDFEIQNSGSSDFSGQQTMFYSNVELRLGFEF